MVAEARGDNPFEQFAGHAACKVPLSSRQRLRLLGQAFQGIGNVVVVFVQVFTSLLDIMPSINFRLLRRIYPRRSPLNHRRSEGDHYRCREGERHPLRLRGRIEISGRKGGKGPRNFLNSLFDDITGLFPPPRSGPKKAPGDDQ